MPKSTVAHTSQQKFTGLSVRAVLSAVVGSALLSLSSCQSASSFSSTEQLSAVAPAPKTIVVSKFSSRETLVDWTSNMQPLFIQARSLVEQHTGVDLSDVSLNMASDKAITDEVSHETRKLIQNQFNDPAFVRQFLNSVMRGQKGTYAALYATRKNEVMVSLPLMRSYQASLSNDKDVQESALLALLIHELVHAADDKQYKIHENRKLNFRASFAQSAAFEGHAQFVTRNICAKSNCLSGLASLDQFMFGQKNPPNELTQTVQAISRNVLEYSYVEGERFVTNLANRPNGQQLIGDLLSNPPQDPIQILDPKSFPNTQREKRNQQLISASTSLSHPWLSGAWTTVQTSPLKGVNLRTDPTRRDAAVDGFTRLITSMVALQLYNQAEPEFAPIELTVLRADTAETAKRFAQTLHENTKFKDARRYEANSVVKVANTPEFEPALLFLTKTPTEDNQTYYTLIGVSEINVVQIAGVGTSDELFVDYVDQLLLKLSSLQKPEIASVI